MFYSRIKKQEELEREKQKLLRIQEIFEENTPALDISNIFVFELDGRFYIVKAEVKNFVGVTCWSSKKREGYHSILTDIFTKKIVFEKQALSSFQREEPVRAYSRRSFAKITPILEIEPDLLAYFDGKVPLYVLLRLYYKLNNVNLLNPILTRKE